jgi:hypothetical protein
MVRGVTSDLQSRRISLIHRRLASVQRDAPLSERRCHFFLGFSLVHIHSQSFPYSWMTVGRKWKVGERPERLIPSTISMKYVFSPPTYLLLINIYSKLIFQTTVRSLSCSEIADDAVLVARLKKLYDTLDSGTTPSTVLIPWFPTPAMIRKLLATKKIYDIVIRAIKAREQSGISRNDTLQMLLDMGDEKLVVVGVRFMHSSCVPN